MTRFDVLALCAVSVSVMLELLVDGLRHTRFFGLRDTLVNLAIYAVYIPVIGFWGWTTYFLYDALHAHALFDLGPEGPLAKAWWPAPWILLVVLDDFTFYTFHRLSHRCRLLWAAHQVHHSSRRFNLSTALRQSWAPFVAMPFWLPLCMLGFDPAAMLWVQGLNLLFQFFLHTRSIPSFGLLDLVLNSPRHHRVHHGRPEEFWDRNFGGLSILWDKLFGTFTAGGPQSFGLDAGEPLGVLSGEFGPLVTLAGDALRAGSPLAALRVAFGPPGGLPPSQSLATGELKCLDP